MAYDEPFMDSALRSTPVIIAYFTMGALWMVELGIIISTLKVMANDPGLCKVIAIFIFGIIEGILVAGQGPLMLWIGVQSMLEKEVGRKL
jgi:hypothetical protein